MITQGYLAISNDNNYPTHKRGVKWIRFVINRDSKSIILITKLGFYELDLNESDGFGKKLKLEFERNLTASNVRTVNEIGAVVTKNENDDWVDSQGNIAQATMGQFDFFEYLAKNQPLQVYPFIDNIILQEDSLYKTYNEFNPYD
jgi:hypothetical protein